MSTSQESDIKIYIKKKESNEYEIHYEVYPQMFKLDYRVEDIESAVWYANQMKISFDRIGKKATIILDCNQSRKNTTDLHHNYLPLNNQDLVMGEDIAYEIGDLFTGSDRYSLIEQWAIVIRSLRTHGYEVSSPGNERDNSVNTTNQKNEQRKYIMTNKQIIELFERHFFSIDNGAVLTDSELISDSEIQVTETDINGNVFSFLLDLDTAQIVDDKTLSVKDLTSNHTVFVKFFDPTPLDMRTYQFKIRCF